MDKYCFSGALTHNRKDVRICGSLFLCNSQNSHLAPDGKSDVGSEELSYLPFSAASSQQVSEDEESRVVGRTCYCRLGNTYPFFLRKIN